MGLNDPLTLAIPFVLKRLIGGLSDLDLFSFRHLFYILKK